MDGDRSGEGGGKNSRCGDSVAWVLKLFPRLVFFLFVESSKSHHLPLPLVSLFPPCHTSLSSHCPQPVKRPSAMFALYANIKVANSGAFLAYLYRFVSYSFLSVLEFALTMPFPPFTLRSGT